MSRAMRTLPPAVEDFVVFLSDARPGTPVKTEAPFHAGKAWWLDVDTLPVVYSEGLGFGLFKPEGEEPSTWLRSPMEAAAEAVRRLPNA